MIKKNLIHSCSKNTLSIAIPPTGMFLEAIWEPGGIQVVL